MSEDRSKWWFRLHEKGGNLDSVPAHRNAYEYLEAYLDSAGIRDEKDSPLFRTVYRRRQLIRDRLTWVDVFRMIRQRATVAGLELSYCCHSFRVTRITADGALSVCFPLDSGRFAAMCSPFILIPPSIPHE